MTSPPASARPRTQLAAAAHLDRTYISHLEHDKYSPTVDALFRICDALGMPASEFIARVEKGRPAAARRKR